MCLHFFFLILSVCRLLEEDSLQIGVLIVPLSSYDSTRNPLYKPNKKSSHTASSPLHGSGRVSASPGEESSSGGEGGRDSEGALMEFEMATNSMHEGLIQMSDTIKNRDEETGQSSSSSSSSAAAPPVDSSGSASAAPRQVVSCSALYSLSVPLGPLLASSFGPGWTHLPSLRGSRGANPLASSAPAPPLSVPVPVSEMLLFDLSNQLYSSQEIFGLGPSAVPPAAAAASPGSSEVRPAETLLDLGGSASASSTPAPPPAAVSSSSTSPSATAAAVASGGKYVAEDCVVCLTDPKEIALLPCRSVNQFSAVLCVA